jgi:hypothetical protein
MGSLDDVYDMLQKLESSDMEYLLITVQKGKKQGKADVFFNLKDKTSMKILATGLSAFNKEINEIERKEKEDDEE